MERELASAQGCGSEANTRTLSLTPAAAAVQRRYAAERWFKISTAAKKEEKGGGRPGKEV